MIVRTAIGAVVLIIAGAAQAARPATIEVSHRVTRLIVPVITATTALDRIDSRQNRDALDRSLRALLTTRTRETDEALAILLGFYLGDESHAALQCELLARGRRPLPLLKRYRNREPQLHGYVYSATLIGPYTEYDDIIGRLSADERCGD